MLKIQFSGLLFIILLLAENTLTNTLPPYIANTLAFFGGLSLKTIPDVIKGELKFKGFLERISKMFGLIVLGYLVWGDRKITTSFFYYVGGATLFFDVIIMVGMRIGSKWITDQGKKFGDE